MSPLNGTVEDLKESWPSGVSSAVGGVKEWWPCWMFSAVSRLTWDFVD